MSVKLSNCPFCGQTPNYHDYSECVELDGQIYEPDAYCANENCPIEGMCISVIDWNNQVHKDTSRLRVMTEAWEKAQAQLKDITQDNAGLYQAIKDGYMIVIPTDHYKLLLDMAKPKLKEEQELTYLKKYNSDGSLRIPHDKQS